MEWNTKNILGQKREYCSSRVISVVQQYEQQNETVDGCVYRSPCSETARSYPGTSACKEHNYSINK